MYAPFSRLLLNDNVRHVGSIFPKLWGMFQIVFAEIRAVHGIGRRKKHVFERSPIQLASLRGTPRPDL